ncbi:hypothetical protein JR316_0004808 [Psilocybe cubensis]|uniref:BTB domain-containing protein n=2 Tax=Psilocybe cubensis TaxID=181762 RepID=A0A8H7Y133_PSICU|nr:hypothetical protein JR316_0004808 [Psilocybe cubensis]KAH9482708.1 hypothetical protein JR316_0004808 [Psilocybe cubensis]
MSSTSTLSIAIPQPQPQPRASRVSSPSSSSSGSECPHSSIQPSHNPRRPSISNTMHWLSRTAVQQQPYSPSKPTRVSEPKRSRTIDYISTPRNGTLGAGATVVRTPDDALRETGIRLSPGLRERETASLSRLSLDQKDSQRKRPSIPLASTSRRSEVLSAVTEPISPPTSPPLPPIPLSTADEEVKPVQIDSPAPKSPPRPIRAPPAPPSTQTQSRRSSMKGRGSGSSSGSDEAPTVPPLPLHVVASTQPPPFQVILVSEPPLTTFDPSKIIVTLETCTATYKTSLSTIYSRPSNLSAYFSNLLSHSDRHSTASVYSTDSDDLAMYNRHLTSQGLLPPSMNIHIFIDRPSSPYSHILSYLRTPLIEGQAEVLPRALQLHSSLSTQARLESLIEVRDEAAFLNLDGLHKLCSDEIRLRYGPRLHTRGNSSGSNHSIHSLHASIYSLHTLLERIEPDLAVMSPSEVTPPATASSKKSTSPEEAFPTKSPPTPQSWDGPRLEQRTQSRLSQHSQGRQSQSSPPAGWI